ncbi:hypothetical protein CRUP_014422 [Coryphaenoides rupestris]|nr:hypothetical protein CRUP_014422 [Coryphaenoides rupestris]
MAKGSLMKNSDEELAAKLDPEKGLMTGRSQGDWEESGGLGGAQTYEEEEEEEEETEETAKASGVSRPRQMLISTPLRKRFGRRSRRLSHMAGRANQSDPAEQADSPDQPTENRRKSKRTKRNQPEESVPEPKAAPPVPDCAPADDTPTKKKKKKGAVKEEETVAKENQPPAKTRKQRKEEKGIVGEEEEPDAAAAPPPSADKKKKKKKNAIGGEEEGGGAEQEEAATPEPPAKKKKKTRQTEKVEEEPESVTPRIHTGLQHSIIRPRQPSCLPPHLHTLPQRLQEAGYATHLLGKWHLGFYRKACLPTRKGFDSFFGSLTGSVDYYSYGSCDGPGLCGYDLHDNEGVAWGQQGRYSTLLYTQRARKILETHDPAAQPLFLMLSLQAVHTPLQPPKSYIYPYRHMYNVARRKYAAMVSTVDEAVHNVTYALRKLGYYRNTVLVFSTDNGAQPFTGGSNWPLRGRKGTYWEGGVRGVAFVHSPLLKRRRRVSKALLHITDWFPHAAGPGRGQRQPGPTPAASHNNTHDAPVTGQQPVATATLQWSQHIWDTSIQAAIRVGDWKLLTGDPGHGDWVPPQMLSSLPGRWSGRSSQRNTGSGLDASSARARNDSLLMAAAAAAQCAAAPAETLPRGPGTPGVAGRPEEVDGGGGREGGGRPRRVSVALCRTVAAPTLRPLAQRAADNMADI